VFEAWEASKQEYDSREAYIQKAIRLDFMLMVNTHVCLFVPTTCFRQRSFLGSCLLVVVRFVVDVGVGVPRHRRWP